MTMIVHCERCVALASAVTARHRNGYDLHSKVMVEKLH